MLVTTLLLIATASQDVSELRFRQAIADNANYHRERFIAAGLMPIEEAAKKGGMFGACSFRSGFQAVRL